MPRNKLFSILPLFIILLSLLSNFLSYTSAETSWTLKLPKLIGTIDISNVERHIEYLSSLGSRVTGYPGFYNASDYILHYFESLGLETSIQTYTVPVPYDYGARIEVKTRNDSFTIKAYPLWPNHLNPCPIPERSIFGPLIYGGTGLLSELDGKKVEGSIVLMEFNSLYWKNVLMLNPQAIIFIEPYETSRSIAQNLMLGVPFNIPRLYVSREDGDRLLSLLKSGNPVEVTLTSNFRWVEVEGRNVIALLRGTGGTKLTIGIVAYFDSLSIVPSVSPGASDAIGIACLMELARVMAENPPYNNILFLAVSGHYQGLAGSRYFIDKYFDWLGMSKENELNLMLMASIDITSESNTLAIKTANLIGDFYSYQDIGGGVSTTPLFERNYLWIRQKIYNDYIPKIFETLDREYPYINLEKVKVYYTPVPSVSDAEPFAIACGGGGISIYTANSMKMSSVTPLDLENKINYDNITPQLELIASILYAFGHEQRFSVPLYPTRFHYLGWGFSTLHATVWKYLPIVGWYVNVSNVIVRISSQWLRSVQQSYSSQGGSIVPGSSFYPSGFDVVAISDENGRIEIPGLQPMVAYTVEALMIDPENGSILMCNDLGSFRGSGQGGVFSNPFSFYKKDLVIRIPVMDCGSIYLTRVVDPKTMAPGVLQVGARYVATGVEIWNFYSHTPPIFYGPVISSQDDVMAFIPINTRVEIMMRAGRTTLTILRNSSHENPFGYGYLIKKGQTIFLDNTPFQMDRELYLLVDDRLDTLTGTGVTYSLRASYFHNRAEEFLQKGLAALANYNYSSAYSHIFNAHSYEITAYSATMQLFFDAVNTVVFFFLLLIPFAYILERLLFSKTGVKRLIYMTVIFLALCGVLYIIHPGFHLTTSVYMLMIGFLVILISLVGFGVIYLGFLAYFKDVKYGYVGPHFSEIDKASAARMALSIGVNNMRRRRFRTLLNMITIIIIVFSMISFTSLELLSITQSYPSGSNPTYNGILIKNPRPMQPIAKEMPEILRYEYGNQTLVAQRVWMYPANLAIHITGPDGEYVVKAVLGLDKSEEDLTSPHYSIMQGRWFRETDRYVALIPSTVVDATGIDWRGGHILIGGLDFVIIGVYDPVVFDSIMDLDENPITPVDMEYFQAYGQPVPLSSKEIIIIPAETAKELLGSNIYSIVVVPKGDLQEIARLLGMRFAGGVTLGLGEGIYKFVTVTRGAIEGAYLTFPLIAIAGLILLNILLGDILGRKNEISIYSVVGLSPTHIKWMFVAEPIIYSVIGATIGYLVGTTGTTLLSILGMLPEGFHPNYSSSWVIISMAVSIIMIMLSSIYPVRKASLLATPSIMRTWRIPTEPTGDIWAIPMPFRESKDLIGGLFAYLYEYLDYHKYEGIGCFYARDICYEETSTDKGTVKTLRALTSLIPWDMSPLQYTSINAYPVSEDTYSIEIALLRKAGTLSTWKASNSIFIDRLRFQFLMWRGISPEMKEIYAQRWKNIVKKLPKCGGET